MIPRGISIPTHPCTIRAGNPHVKSMTVAWYNLVLDVSWKNTDERRSFMKRSVLYIITFVRVFIARNV